MAAFIQLPMAINWAGYEAAVTVPMLINIEHISVVHPRKDDDKQTMVYVKDTHYFAIQESYREVMRKIEAVT